MAKKLSGETRPIQECDPLVQAKHNLEIWLLVRDPTHKVQKINHPLIKSFWDFYQEAAKVTFTEEQKEEIFHDRFKEQSLFS